MGCAGSKQKRQCERCNVESAPVRKSYSVQLDHHLERGKSDSFHLVALTSSSLGFGSLRIDLSSSLSEQLEFDFLTSNDGGNVNKCKEKSGKEEFLEVIGEAKTWSCMIKGKIPKTPIRTPEGEPEMIDAKELMQGLEDISPFRSPNHVHSVSCNAILSPIPESLKMDIISDFDPDEIASFQKSLELIPNTFLSPLTDQEKPEPTRKERVVLYFTSLRGVRKTYDDCCDMRVILKSAGVRVDERDVSMHSGFKDELKELLGEQFTSSSLPRVFLGDKYIGGAEEIRRLHEEGRLEKELEGCEMVGSDRDSIGIECEACGDVRFVPCETCSGSCKIYCDDNDVAKEDEDNKRGCGQQSNRFGFHRCPDCNENGLVRCPLCCF